MFSTLSPDCLPGNYDIKGLVSADVVIGISYFKDFRASFRDIFGGRCKSYENEFAEGRAYVLSELGKEALRLGADKVCGLRIEIEPIGPKGAMFLIMAYGTAVKTKS